MTDAALQDPAPYELRILDPHTVRIHRQGGVPRITLEGDRSFLKLMVARAFPMSDPAHYIGLLDGGGKDIGILVDPEHLDADSRHVLDEELERRYFIPVVDRVMSVKEEYGAVYWNVSTDRGDREFVVRNLRDNLQELTSIRVIITDVDGNRFEIRDLDRMDMRTQNIILRNL